MSTALKLLRCINEEEQPQNPDAFSFNDTVDENLDATVTSNQITVTGLNAGYPVDVSCNVGEIDAGTSALSGTWGTSKTVTVSGSGTIVLRARRTSSTTYYDTVTQIITVGTGNTTWSIRTRDVDLIPGSDSRGSTAYNVAPSATPIDIGAVYIQQLTPNATYGYRTTSSISGVTYEEGSNDTLPVTSFATYNTSTSTFTTDSSGRVYVDIRALLEYYWLQARLFFNIKSSYSGLYNSSYTWSFATTTQATFTVTPALTQTVAGAGVWFEWQWDVTNLPVALGDLDLDFDSDYFGIGLGFDLGEGYSLVSGGPYTRRLVINNHSSSSITVYMGMESKTTGLGNRRLVEPSLDLTFSAGSSDILRTLTTAFQLELNF